MKIKKIRELKELYQKNPIEFYLYIFIIENGIDTKLYEEDTIMRLSKLYEYMKLERENRNFIHSDLKNFYNNCIEEETPKPLIFD